eukprot:748247_1
MFPSKYSLLLLLSEFHLTVSTVGYFIGTDTSGTLTAGEVCNNTGGRLAIFNSASKFTEASTITSQSGYEWVAVALHCTSRDTTSCLSSPTEWTWYDSTNNNNDLCDISRGCMDTLTYYQPWDRWNKIQETNEFCVEFYGGKFVLELCGNKNEIIIESDDQTSPNAALCQPSSYSIADCTGAATPPPTSDSYPDYFVVTDHTGTLTASEVCNNAGGRLAIVNSTSKFTEASTIVSQSGYEWVPVALHCTSRDTSCSTSPSKWTWYDSTNNNDLYDISQGGMEQSTYYQPWDKWDKTPAEENEYCVEFYGGKFVLELCSNVNGIIIDSGHQTTPTTPNAALCQPLSYPITYCTSTTENSDNCEDITATYVACTGGGTDFSGNYYIQFETVCRNMSTALSDYCRTWLGVHEAQIVDPASGKVFLDTRLTWKDEICDPQIFDVQFTATMQFYEDGTWNAEVSDGYLYEVGNDTVYARVTTDYPSTQYDVFRTKLLNVTVFWNIFMMRKRAQCFKNLRWMK